MKMKRIGLVGALAAAIILAGCGSQEQDWQHAQQQNTLAAYRTFINKYPDSKQAMKARQRIAQIKQQQERQQQQQAWNAARHMNTVVAYRQFLQQYPNSPQADQARQQIADLQRQADWQSVQESQNIQMLQAFAGKYPNSPQASQAQARINQIKAQQAQASKQPTGAPVSQPVQKTQQAQAAPAPKGDYVVQLAAFSSKARASKAQQQLQDNMKETFGVSLAIEPPAAGGTYYRLITTPLSRQDAVKLCAALKSKGQDCLVRRR